MPAFTDTIWLLEGTLSGVVYMLTVAAAVVRLNPICDLLFIEGLEGMTLTEVMFGFVKIQTESCGLCFEDQMSNFPKSVQM